ncbi:MAG: hypothetical protein CVV46_08270 [Spirochaetae bacterium HGW-Spirochaetae-2]|jgi:site-specific DNA-methyltransferase (adenine-specific)/adenine-specific DNA-methyltransferase|nr:MAG: hypothetical protein CVV46_08270 [Spirochaetae bacterium HGW-Spirochaetae-2]
MEEFEKKYLIDLIENDKTIPLEWEKVLFPTIHKEYELAYANKLRKEDILANDDGSFPVPLQIDKRFSFTHENAEEWKNLVVYGDNLQFLKTIFENKDVLIKDKIKKRVKLIYIDPPFATSEEFQSKEGARAYNDKKKGAEFIEYLRKRLILAKEVLSDDGTIYVHIDSKMGHYIKVIMDEIFEGFEFSEIIWVCGLMGSGDVFPKAHETIYCYRSRNAYFNPPNRLGLSTRITKALLKDDKGWYYTRGRESSGGMKALKTYLSLNPKLSKQEVIDQANIERKQPAWSVWIGKEDIATSYNDFPVGTYAYTKTESRGYPTQKPEKLLKRIIEASTQEGDLVLDFFGGSGTTAAVAEKLNRRWVTCDVGKYSFFTTQKRILQISQSKDLNNNKKLFSKNPLPFITCCLDNYDLKVALQLEWSHYKDFISGLFNIKLKSFQISGLYFEGTKEEFPVIIFNYAKYKESNVDELFIESVHSSVGHKLIGSRVYIVAPSSRVDFITDYVEYDTTRYYFLKIPYQMIRELHQKPFHKFRQPQSKKMVNSLDEAVGFSFNRIPEVTTKFMLVQSNLTIQIVDFNCKERAISKSDAEMKLEGIDLLSAIFIDRCFDGELFKMTDSFFFEELDKTKEGLQLVLRGVNTSKSIMIVYSDIYGNDFTELIDLSRIPNERN